MPTFQLDLSIMSEAHQVLLLSGALRGACQQLKLPSATVDAIVLGTVEAVNNCVEHAYSNRPDGKIELNCQLAKDQLAIEIRNDGNAIAEPPDFELPDFDSESGRGWFIIGSCFDTVSWDITDNGRNRLRLTKHITGRE